jgi:hypothetical protein
MAGTFDPTVVFDPLAALAQHPCGSLLAQPMPERGGNLRAGADCGCGCSGDTPPTGSESNAPPGDGTEGVQDPLLCR